VKLGESVASQGGGGREIFLGTGDGVHVPAEESVTVWWYRRRKRSFARGGGKGEPSIKKEGLGFRKKSTKSLF